jgi:hypothetical protein
MAIPRTTTSPKTAGTPTAGVPLSPGKAPAAAKTAPAAESRTDQIAQRAFQIWEQSGRRPGRDLENWLQAEAELRR